MMSKMKRKDFKKGYILVVNLRDGHESRIGGKSGHWPEDILKVSKYYSSDLEDVLSYEVSRHKLRFPVGRVNLIWVNGEISVYEFL